LTKSAHGFIVSLTMRRNLESHYSIKNFTVDLRLPFQNSRVVNNLGLHTENPFTQTPAKKMLSRVGLGPDFARSEIRKHYSWAKRFEYHMKAKDVAFHATVDGRTMDEVEELIFGGEKNRVKIRAMEESAKEAALIASDANQGEVDYLVGITGRDPSPMHRIHFDAGNTEPHRVEVVFPHSEPLVAIKREDVGEAQYRAFQQRTSRISRGKHFGDRHIITEHISRKTRLKIGPIELPLPPKRQTLVSSESIGH
jgi:hypothetical protein